MNRIRIRTSTILLDTGTVGRYSGYFKSVLFIRIDPQVSALIVVAGSRSSFEFVKKPVRYRIHFRTLRIWVCNTAMHSLHKKQRSVEHTRHIGRLRFSQGLWSILLIFILAIVWWPLRTFSWSCGFTLSPAGMTDIVWIISFYSSGVLIVCRLFRTNYF